MIERHLIFFWKIFKKLGLCWLVKQKNEQTAYARECFNFWSKMARILGQKLRFWSGTGLNRPGPSQLNLKILIFPPLLLYFLFNYYNLSNIQFQHLNISIELDVSASAIRWTSDSDQSSIILGAFGGLRVTFGISIHVREKILRKIFAKKLKTLQVSGFRKKFAIFFSRTRKFFVKMTPKPPKIGSEKSCDLQNL